MFKIKILLFTAQCRKEQDYKNDRWNCIPAYILEYGEMNK